MSISRPNTFQTGNRRVKFLVYFVHAYVYVGRLLFGTFLFKLSIKSNMRKHTTYIYKMTMGIRKYIRVCIMHIGLKICVRHNELVIHSSAEHRLDKTSSNTSPRARALVGMLNIARHKTQSRACVCLFGAHYVICDAPDSRAASRRKPESTAKKLERLARFISSFIVFYTHCTRVRVASEAEVYIYWHD